MKLSLSLLIVCLVGYGMCLPTTTEIKKTVICEECEFSGLDISPEDLTNIKLVKMQKCLASMKNEINKKEHEKRVAREAGNQDEPIDTETSFEDMFKSSAAFKRVLNQYMKLKQTVISKTNQLQKNINNALVDFANDEEQQTEEKKIKMPIQQTKESKKPKNCAHKMTCEKPNTVIKVKQAILTTQDHEQKCASLSQLLPPFNMENMNDNCYDKEKTTQRLISLCDGEKECEVSITQDFDAICDCTEKKHVEIEYTCEPETEETKHSVAKRSMYYQNSNRDINEFNRYRDGILDYYGQIGLNYNYDYYPYDYCVYGPGLCNDLNYYDDLNYNYPVARGKRQAGNFHYDYPNYGPNNDYPGYGPNLAPFYGPFAYDYLYGPLFYDYLYGPFAYDYLYGPNYYDYFYGPGPLAYDYAYDYYDYYGNGAIRLSGKANTNKASKVQTAKKTKITPEQRKAQKQQRLTQQKKL